MRKVLTALDIALLALVLVFLVVLFFTSQEVWRW
jgi:uncharacterized protein involved in outer membrane biogenesis